MSITNSITKQTYLISKQLNLTNLKINVIIFQTTLQCS